MKNSIKLTQLLLLLIFLTSCKSTDYKEELIKDSQDQKSQQIKPFQVLMHQNQYPLIGCFTL